MTYRNIMNCQEKNKIIEHEVDFVALMAEKVKHDQSKLLYEIPFIGTVMLIFLYLLNQFFKLFN